MSAVLQRTKQLYSKALCLEIILFTVIISAGAILNEHRTTLSALFGILAGFIPHGIFVFWVFFRKTIATQTMTVFYRGEGLKWLSAIILISVALVSYREMNYLAFFIGYLLALGANGIMPIILKLNVN